MPFFQGKSIGDIFNDDRCCECNGSKSGGGSDPSGSGVWTCESFDNLIMGDSVTRTKTGAIACIYRNGIFFNLDQVTVTGQVVTFQSVFNTSQGGDTTRGEQVTICSFENS